MCSMGLLNAALPEQEMNALYQLHHSDTFSLTEQTTSEPWQQMQQRLMEKVFVVDGWHVVCRVLRGSEHSRHRMPRLFWPGSDRTNR